MYTIKYHNADKWSGDHASLISWRVRIIPWVRNQLCWASTVS